MEGVSDVLWDGTWQGLCREALAGIPAGDSALRARLLAMLVVADTWRSLADAKPRAAEALAMAERAGERRAVIEALRASQIAHSGPDGARDRLRSVTGCSLSARTATTMPACGGNFGASMRLPS